MNAWEWIQIRQDVSLAHQLKCWPEAALTMSYHKV